MKKSAVKTSPENWLALIEEQQKSGLSQKAFCQQNNLVLSQFVYYRLRHLKQKTGLNPVAGFVPVNVIPSESKASEIKVVLPNGFQCSFSSSLDINQLKSLMGVLLTC